MGGAVWAMGGAIVALGLGCLPIALIGIALSEVTRRGNHEWPAGWRTVFQAGFVFQICSLAVTSLTAVAFLLSIPLGGDAWERAAAVAFSASVGAGCVALAAWRRLMNAVAASSPPSIRF